MARFEEDALVRQGVIPPSEFRDAVERIREIAGFDIEVPPDFNRRLELASRDLLIEPETLKAAAAALRVGHLVLQGPPGTGKSSLARALCDAFNVSVLPVTAHEDWTVFDVIGRLELRLTSDRREEVVPINGYFTQAIVSCADAIVRHFDDPTVHQAQWLLIDELNRANVDRAFGELFSVLGTDAMLPITLPHQREGNREMVVPRRFRIIATLNSFDRQFVNNLSQAIRRRFTFITLGIPARRTSGTQWTDETSTELAIAEFRLVARRAARRAAERLAGAAPTEVAELERSLLALLTGELSGHLSSLFDLVEKVRYSDDSQQGPHLPIGTSQLIDTVELFVIRMMQDQATVSDAGPLLDWAAAVKLAPLFDSDTVAPEVLSEFCRKLSSPFDQRTRREMMGIVAAGSHFVS